MQHEGKCVFLYFKPDMKKYIIIMGAALCLISACRTKALPPRPTIPLVETIVRDTSGLAELVAKAGASGANGSIAILGEKEQTMALARLFLSIDARDNIDGRSVRDSLPDFAGEQFQVIIDENNSPYSHFLPGGLDSLREAAVQGAMFAWDTTCLKTRTSARNRLPKENAKILVFSSPLNSAYGLFDVDTLRQLCSGKCMLATPVETTLKDAVKAGASNIAVWASRDIRSSRAYEDAFADLQAEGTVTTITPESALDIRTQFRSLLRQYQATGLSLDALVLSEYTVDTQPLWSEIELIRSGVSEEDSAFNRMLSGNFVIIDPGTSLTSAIFSYMRGGNLFTHRIALPSARWFVTTESENGNPDILEVGTSYLRSAYVQDFD